MDTFPREFAEKYFKEGDRDEGHLKYVWTIVEQKRLSLHSEDYYPLESWFYSKRRKRSTREISLLAKLDEIERWSAFYWSDGNIDAYLFDRSEQLRRSLEKLLWKQFDKELQDLSGGVSKTVDCSMSVGAVVQFHEYVVGG